MKLFNKESKVEISVLQTELTRLHTLLILADRKIAFIFVIYSVIFGFYFQKFSSILKTINEYTNFMLIFFIFVFLVYGFMSIYLTIFARVKNENDKPLLFFLYTSTLGLKKYEKTLLNISENNFKKEVIEQIYTVSKIISNKMIYTNSSIHFLIILLGFSLIYLYFNFDLILGK